VESGSYGNKRSRVRKKRDAKGANAGIPGAVLHSAADNKSTWSCMAMRWSGHARTSSPGSDKEEQIACSGQRLLGQIQGSRRGAAARAPLRVLCWTGDGPYFKSVPFQPMARVLSHSSASTCFFTRGLGTRVCTFTFRVCTFTLRLVVTSRLYSAIHWDRSAHVVAGCSDPAHAQCTSKL
jgi:hypothetical protein